MPRIKPTDFSLTTNALVSAAIIVCALYFARDILLPFALAILLSFLLSPLVERVYEVVSLARRVGRQSQVLFGGRNQLMGHVPADATRGKGPLGMTAVYSHASPAIVRRQLVEALCNRPAMEFLRGHTQRTECPQSFHPGRLSLKLILVTLMMLLPGFISSSASWQSQKVA